MVWYGVVWYGKVRCEKLLNKVVLTSTSDILSKSPKCHFPFSYASFFLFTGDLGYYGRALPVC